MKETADSLLVRSAKGFLGFPSIFLLDLSVSVTEREISENVRVWSQLAELLLATWNQANRIPGLKQLISRLSVVRSSEI